MDTSGCLATSCVAPLFVVVVTTAGVLKLFTARAVNETRDLRSSLLAIDGVSALALRIRK